MRKSLDWGAMAACLFLVIIVIALTIGTVNMAMVEEMPRGNITSGIVGCAIVASMTLFAVVFTYQQFIKKERARKMRKTVNEFKGIG